MTPVPLGHPPVDEDLLDDVEALEGADPSRMLRTVATAGAQVREALATTDTDALARVAADGRPRAVVVAGMGGSAVAGDVLGVCAAAGSPVPVLTHRGHGLPGWVGAADLVVAMSCSGRTEETLSAAVEAGRRGARLVGVAADRSPLAQVVGESGGPVVTVPGGRPPRASTWSMLTPLLLLGEQTGVLRVSRGDLESVADLLDAVADRCRPSSEAFVNPAKALALECAGTLPMVWGSTPLAGVAAGRFVNQLAENAKHPAVPGALPEAGHNLVVTFDGPWVRPAEDDLFRDRVDDGPGPPRLRLVLLRDRDEPQPLRVRADAVRAGADRRGIAHSEVRAEGDTAIERLASLVALGDFASVYLALLLGVDPTPVGPIDELKQALADAAGAAT